MKKPVLLVSLAAAVVLVIIGAIVFGKSDNKKTSAPVQKTASSSSNSSYKNKNACEILTPAIAQEIGGPDAKAASPSPATSSSDILLSNCSYYSISTKTSVTLLVRAPKTKDGADSNKQQFTSGLPSGTEKVTGYGDSAYWSPQYGQFNILKHGAWYILQSGPLRPTDRTQDATTAFATRIIDSL